MSRTISLRCHSRARKTHPSALETVARMTGWKRHGRSCGGTILMKNHDWPETYKRAKMFAKLIRTTPDSDGYFGLSLLYQNQTMGGLYQIHTRKEVKGCNLYGSWAQNI